MRIIWSHTYSFAHFLSAAGTAGWAVCCLLCLKRYSKAYQTYGGMDITSQWREATGLDGRQTGDDSTGRRVSLIPSRHRRRGTV